MSAVDDRRRRALEAYWDQLGTRSAEVAAQEAIETATRVKITPEAIAAAYGSTVKPMSLGQRLARTLTELGFEVEE